jgi:hypothetical protein
MSAVVTRRLPGRNGYNSPDRCCIFPPLLLQWCLVPHPAPTAAGESTGRTQHGMAWEQSRCKVILACPCHTHTPSCC